MNNEKRIAELLSQITSFSKNSYTKAEYLHELLKLQQEIVDLTFKDNKAEKGELRLRHVEKRLRRMNKKRGHIADDELAKFINGSKAIRNVISSESSGNEGEEQAFRALNNLRRQNGVLYNVELAFNGIHTEIDAVVFTNRAIFLIEVKNGKKDIFIDEKGDYYYKAGSSMKYDCNIAEKMHKKETVLRLALKRSGMERSKIFKILVFANDQINVENKYRYIKVCSSDDLHVFINKFKSDFWYSYEELCIMMAAVTEVKRKKPFKMSINMDEFKADFANLMVILEAGE